MEELRSMIKASIEGLYDAKQQKWNIEKWVESGKREPSPPNNVLLEPCIQPEKSSSNKWYVLGEGVHLKNRTYSDFITYVLGTQRKSDHLDLEAWLAETFPGHVYKFFVTLT
jgi:hypothetical protein